MARLTERDGRVYLVSDQDKVLETWSEGLAVVGGSSNGAYIPEDFGSLKVGTGQIDDAPAINAALAACVSPGGGAVYLQQPVYTIKTPIVIPGPNIRLFGPSPFLTKLVRAGTGVGTVITNDNMDGTVLEGFSIDGGLSGFPTNANQAVRVFDSNNVLCRGLRLSNYFNCAILGFVTTPGSKSGVIYDSCWCDGATGANNGFLIVDMDDSGMRHCRAYNLSGANGPNYGLQLKNNCRYSFIEDGFASNCVVGFAFGNDTNTEPSVSHSRVTGGIALNCNSGFLGGYFDNCEVADLVIKQQAGNLEAVRVQGSAHDNSIRISVISGTPSPKGAVRFDNSAHDNFVEVGLLDAACGSAGQFENTSADNMVFVRRYGVNKPGTDKNGSSSGTGNLVSVGLKSVTGAKGGNAALASLLTTLAAQGFIIDNTSA